MTIAIPGGGDCVQKDNGRAVIPAAIAAVFASIGSMIRTLENVVFPARHGLIRRVPSAAIVPAPLTGWRERGH